jgi:hypothetical protein
MLVQFLALLAILYPQEDSWFSFLLENELMPGATNQTCNLLACNMVPQPTMLLCAPLFLWYCDIHLLLEINGHC